MNNFESVLLSKKYNLRYGVPTKVTTNQYRTIIFGEGRGMCFGDLINGEYYLRLKANRYKFFVELILLKE